MFYYTTFIMTFKLLNKKGNNHATDIFSHENILLNAYTNNKTTTASTNSSGFLKKMPLPSCSNIEITNKLKL